jgi:hypothetical protein
MKRLVPSDHFGSTQGFKMQLGEGRNISCQIASSTMPTTLKRFLSSDYVPINECILRCWVMTTSITESSFSYNDFGYRIIDVGGSRSQRRKWKYSSNDIWTVVFTIDTRNYAKTVARDKKVNRMQEQLALFDSIVNSRWFERCSFIIVCTKIDMLEEWLLKTPVEKYLFD